MRSFRAQLKSGAAVADASQGFVWRRQCAAGDGTSIRAFDDDRILFNMSVWDSIDSLHAYVYHSGHVGPMRKRREWFEPLSRPALVLWWIPIGHTPTVAEALERFDRLATLGPTPDAFTFRQAFAPPGDTARPALDIDAEFCEPTR
jgi:hypothetical protein